jgi:hypothetical protein
MFTAVYLTFDMLVLSTLWFAPVRWPAFLNQMRNTDGVQGGLYDGLQVPRENLVGKLNEGWQVGDSKAGNARSDRK